MEVYSGTASSPENYVDGGVRVHIAHFATVVGESYTCTVSNDDQASTNQQPAVMFLNALSGSSYGVTGANTYDLAISAVATDDGNVSSLQFMSGGVMLYNDIS